jgi:hypothetical protein
MNRRFLVAVALSAALVGAVAGCTAETPSAAPSTTPTPAPATTEPAETPSSLITECDDLVSPSDQKKYEAEGWALSDDFVQRMTDQKSHLVTFVDYGGALCQWGFPNSDATDVLAGSAIDDAHEAEQRAYLEAEGFTLDQHNGADRYIVTSDTFTEIYLFAGDYWFYGSSEAAIDRSRQFADVG